MSSQAKPVLSAALCRAMRQIRARRDAGAAFAGAMLLVAAPASQALTLGTITVRSALGQRLDASVAVRLAEGESLAGNCIEPVYGRTGLAGVPQPRVITPNVSRAGVHHLQVTTRTALYEPMYELELQVNCPGMAQVVRQYVLMLDLPSAAAPVEAAASSRLMPAAGRETAATATPDAASLTARAGIPVSAPTDATNGVRQSGDPATGANLNDRRTPGTPLVAGAVYRVSAGDTLSSIAARVQGRTVNLWAMADAIFAANPAAFIRNEPDLIKLGSEIVIPANAVANAGLLAPSKAPQSIPEPARLPVAPQPLPVIPTPSQTATEPPRVVSAATDVVVPAAAEGATTTPAQPSLAASARTAPTPATPPRPGMATSVAPAPVTPGSVMPNSATPSSAGPSSDEGSGNTFLAIGAGLLFGLIVTALFGLFLWLTGRKSVAKAAAVRNPDSDRDPVEPVARAAPIPLVTRTTEPAFSVTYTAADEDPLAAEFGRANYATMVNTQQPIQPPPIDDITSELEELFDGTDTRMERALAVEALELDVPDLANDEPTLGGQTLDQPRPVRATVVEEPDALSNTGSIDLNALASSATRDPGQTRSLLDALTLLERDYEEELTASQVVDMAAMREALADSDDEPTQIRKRSR